MAEKTEEQIPEEQAIPEVEAPEEDGALNAALKSLGAEEEGKPAEEPKEETIEEPQESEKPEEKPEQESEEGEKPEEKPEEEPEEDGEVEEEIRGFGLKEKAAERFRGMASELKELRAFKEEAEPLQEKAEQYDQIIESWNTVQATPEQVSTAQAIIGAVNSGDPDKIAEVAKAYRQAADSLEQGLGIKSDTTALDPDLQQRVEEYGLDPESAAEIMRHRALEKQRQQYGEKQAQQTQEQYQREQARQQGVAQIEALSGELAQADPDFERKLPYLQPALEQIRDHLPPNQWAQAVREAYSRIPELPPADVEAARRAHKANPVRPTGSPPNLAPKPKSADDAVARVLFGGGE